MANYGDSMFGAGNKRVPAFAHVLSGVNAGINTGLSVYNTRQQQAARQQQAQAAAELRAMQMKKLDAELKDSKINMAKFTLAYNAARNKLVPDKLRDSYAQQAIDSIQTPAQAQFLAHGFRQLQGQGEQPGDTLLSNPPQMPGAYGQAASSMGQPQMQQPQGQQQAEGTAPPPRRTGYEFQDNSRSNVNLEDITLNKAEGELLGRVLGYENQAMMGRERNDTNYDIANIKGMTQVELQGMKAELAEKMKLLDERIKKFTVTTTESGKNARNKADNAGKLGVQGLKNQGAATIKDKDNEGKAYRQQKDLDSKKGIQDSKNATTLEAARIRKANSSVSKNPKVKRYLDALKFNEKRKSELKKQNTLGMDRMPKSFQDEWKYVEGNIRELEAALDAELAKEQGSASPDASPSSAPPRQMNEVFGPPAPSPSPSRTPLPKLRTVKEIEQLKDGTIFEWHDGKVLKKNGDEVDPV